MPEHRRDGKNMQRRVAEFEKELTSSLDEIWFKGPEEAPVDSWGSRMEEVAKEKRINAIDKVPKPDLPSHSTKWRIGLLDLET